jgi:hypothetical protein
MCPRKKRNYMRTLTLRLVLCFLLVAELYATPITYQQVTQQVGQGQQPPKPDPNKVAGDKPDFVHLADGRVVPYGPGVICSDDCIGSEALALSDAPLPPIPNPGLSPWFLAVPAIIGGVVACVMLCRGGDATIVSAAEPPRIINPPSPPPADVPEPATLVLLGLGLAMIARHGLSKKKDPDKSA